MVAELRKQRLYSASASGIEETETLLRLRKLLFDEPVGIDTHHPLGQVEWLDIEKPVPGERRPLFVDVVVQVMLRNDVEDRRAHDLLRMIETHAMQYAAAAIMSGSVKFVEPKRRHHLNLIMRHGAE